ncbi:hypothetical protein TUM20983_03840 [Mycobacterium antarcticum]|uniref:YqjF family protein n=1 Tax=unclassified Mycolicibacterium TaxID=2636767 RepID=UPI0023A386EA|nr:MULTISPECIES: DUF2071 domain-containing protein [unclassified Mycolicibacterium]GLP73274.1 hypothetical protein TUM20983_03840 [Mycolicibacterium sp. TUM20983]GLP78988.1 hypothetical protein TUM20984_04080 [Mycolicibacterium sp. TUM20984]
MSGALPDGFPVTAPILPRPIFTRQRWTDLTFVHWPVDPDAVAHMFPSGTRPDVFADGQTYVGLVPFGMSGLSLGIPQAIPYFGSFLETNVRLYSTDDAGRHGVLFRSLETARLAVVPATRIALGTPYTWAKMRLMRDGSRITYDSVRRLPRRGLRCRLTIEVGDVVDPTPVEVWLTARWGAHTRKGGRTWWVPNEHVPFPFRAAEVLELSDDLVAASGVVPTGERLRALYSPGVQTSFGRPAKL